MVLPFDTVPYTVTGRQTNGRTDRHFGDLEDRALQYVAHSRNKTRSY